MVMQRDPEETHRIERYTAMERERGTTRYTAHYTLQDKLRTTSGESAVNLEGTTVVASCLAK